MRRRTASARLALGALGIVVLVLLVVPPALARPSADGSPLADEPAPPTRVLLLGDSLGASLGDALTRELAAAGAAFEYAGYPATGPLTYQGEFWKAQLAAHLTSFDPDYVVIQPSGCYALFQHPPFVSADGSELLQGSAEFFEQWNAHVASLVEQVEAHGATAAILTAPITAEHAHTHRFWAEYNAGYRQLAESTGVALLDWNELFAPHGRFQETMETIGGEVVVRESDGIHFTPLGIELVAEWVADAVTAPDANWFVRVYLPLSP